MMKKLLVLILIVVLSHSAIAASLNWWGLVSFRERHEVLTEYTDYTQSGEPGTERYTDCNSTTKLGYKLGVKLDLAEHLSAALTLRSGLRAEQKGSVMWQDINNSTGLLPGIQEAYLDWKTPYVEAELGKIPQDGTAMWDLYAAVNQTDERLYNPTDGIFNDRFAALNGARISVPVDIFHEEITEYQGYKLPQPVVLSHLSVTPRAIYHVDKVAGYRREWAASEQPDERDLDWYAVFIGAEMNYANPLLDYTLDADYGMPYRLGDKYIQDDKDSVYAAEMIWGVTNTLKSPLIFNLMLQMSFGYNWRDSIFTARFWDYTAAAEFKGFRLTGRYQVGSHEHEFGNYIGSKALNSAWHVYLNKTVWDLDIQPRVIWFKTDIDQGGLRKQQRALTRYELTMTAKF